MNQSGKASIISIAAIFAILLVVGLLAFSRESLTTVGARFMNALANGDVDRLTKMSYLDKGSEEEMRKKWDFAVNKAAPYYVFAYRITASKQIDANTGSVALQVVRDANSPSAYEERFELPMIKVDDEWKVDVRALSRDLYPALPQ